MVATPAQSAVILPVPEADAVIGEWRRRLDRSAAWGVPAHVTLLFPFVAPADIDARVLAAVADAIAGNGPVAFSSSRCAGSATGRGTSGLSPTTRCGRSPVGW